MCEVHRGPIQYACVSPDIARLIRKEVGDKKGLECSPPGMEGRERSEDQWGIVEGDFVSARVENSIYSGETTRRAPHGIVGWRQPVDELVPWSGTWKDDLSEDSSEVHVSEHTTP